MQWVEATKDDRIQPALFAWARRLHQFLLSKPLVKGSWSQMRWQEGAFALEWLLDYAGGTASEQDVDTVVALIKLLSDQGMQWADWVASDELSPFTVLLFLH